MFIAFQVKEIVNGCLCCVLVREQNKYYEK
jgi:G3E family GTPase